MFSDEHNTSMYDLNGVCLDTSIGGWSRWGSLKRMRCPGNMDPRVMLNKPLLRHAEERSYMRRRFAFMCQFDENTRFDKLEFFCLDLQFDQFSHV